MPVPTETLWNIRKVSIVFAASSVALLGSLLWMVKVDYDRPWRHVQDNYVDLQATLAYYDVLGTKTGQAQEELANAKAALDAARERFNTHQERVGHLLTALASDGAIDARPLAEEILAVLAEEPPAAVKMGAVRLGDPFQQFIAELLDNPDPAVLAGRLSGEQDVRGQFASLLGWFDQARLRDQLDRIRGRYAATELEQKNLKSEMGVAAVLFEQAAGLNGSEDPRTKARQAALERLQKGFADARLAYDQLADERQDIERQMRDLTAGVTDAEKALAKVEKERADAEKKYADLSSAVKRGLFNLPLLDFAAPKGTPGRHEVKQVVLPDVKLELNFLQGYATDRCMTCHVAIDNRNFTRASLATRLEKAVFSINEELAREGRPALTPPVVAEREDLEPGSIAAAWPTLTPAQQEAFFDGLVQQVNRYQRMRGEEELKFGQPLLAHPDLDLYVANDSAHPISRMGCTVCHEGNGEETDFVLAAHTPKTHEEREEWKRKYYVRSAGVIPEQNFETAEHHWDRPMLVPKYSEASCTKCHTEATDVAYFNNAPAAAKINEGRFLFKTVGCINCHLVEELEGARRVGPELRHVGEKLTRGFMHNWIWFPKDYRPSTWMPHYFQQENNDAGSETGGGDRDPELRTRTEVVALTEYLLASSKGYTEQVPELPENLWKPIAEDEEAHAAAADRGRKLFGSVGCLACHAALAYQPDDEEAEDGLGEPLGQRWIRGDLIDKLEALTGEVKRARALRLKHRMMEMAREDGADPAEVSLNDDEKNAARLAISTEDDPGDGIALGPIIEAFDKAFTGPRYNEPAARREAIKATLGKVAKVPAGVTISEDEEDLVYVGDDAFDAIWEHCNARYEELDYNHRVEYALANFPDGTDTLLRPDSIGEKPVFTRFGPELSSMGTKFATDEDAVRWLFLWLKDPQHYSTTSKMPSLRLSPYTAPGEEGAEGTPADEALDLAVYLSTLKENETFSTEPFDADPEEGERMAEMRDELILNLLGALNSQARARSILNDETGELSSQLVSRLSSSLGEDEAGARIASMDLGQRQWMFLGDKLMTHYGCSACHLVAGYERAVRPGTEVSTWGEKQLSKLDFGFFEHEFEKDRKKDPLFHGLYPENREKLIEAAHTNPHEAIEHSLASFAWHKMRNPRIYDRRKLKGPYEKLKMPNFFFTDDQADALVTFLLSRKPPRVGESLQVDYAGTPEGRVARGRDLAWELNCVACHKIDANVAVINQFFRVDQGGETVFDEVNAPPWLRGQGSKIKPAWLYGFLNDVQMLRPWLKVRMPSFHLEPKQAGELVEYFVGLSQEESDWLNEHIRHVERYRGESHKAAGGSEEDEAGADWFTRPEFARLAEELRAYGVTNRLVTEAALDPAENDTEDLAARHADLVASGKFLRQLYDIRYPFNSDARPAPTADELADGETLFYELRCMACHVFGDPSIPGANASPSAPNLQLTHDRLRQEWVLNWLIGPGRMQPGTKMPNVFGENQDSAFKSYPEEDRARVIASLRDPGLIDDGARQIELLTAFLYDAGGKRLNKIQPPAEPAPEEPADGAPEEASPETPAEPAVEESAPAATEQPTEAAPEESDSEESDAAEPAVSAESSAADADKPSDEATEDAPAEDEAQEVEPASPAE